MLMLLILFFFTEALACEQAHRFAQEVGFQRISMEGDSLIVIKKIHAQEKDTSVISPI